VERVSSANSGPVRRSLPLCCHHGHCSTIPSTVRAQDDKTSPHPLLCDLQPSVSPTLKADVQTTTKREAPTPLPSKPLLVKHRTHHDAPRSKIRQNNHQLHVAVHHTDMCSSSTMRHDCKPPPLGL
jgi:hypothetical protein